jgi:hypothetical protein
LNKPLPLPDSQPITARLAAAGSRRRELEAVLAEGGPAATRADYGDLILERNVVGKSSAVSRLKVLKQLRERYLLDPTVTEFVAFRAAIEEEHGSAERGLLCFLMMARCDRLFREAALLALSRDATAQLRRNGGSGANLDLEAFAAAFRAYLQRHDLAWSQETKEHALRHVLSSLKDFGVLLGSAKKSLTYRVPGPSSAAFAARLSELEGLTGRQTLSSQWFALLGSDAAGAAELLRSAQREGLVSFREQADVVELKLPPVTIP